MKYREKTFIFRAMRKMAEVGLLSGKTVHMECCLLRGLKIDSKHIERVRCMRGHDGMMFFLRA